MSLDEITLAWLGIASVLSFVISLIAIPWLLVRMPADYFSTSHRPIPHPFGSHPAVRLLVMVVKNLFGICFVVIGFVLLFLPGQGLLTLFIGLVLMDYPGKYKLERRIITNPTVLKSINALRRRAGRDPLLL